MVSPMNKSLSKVLDLLFLTFPSQAYTEVAVTYWCGPGWP